MTENTRRQLTLFVQKKDAKNIEDVRSKFNPRQNELIDSQITLFREDEIAGIDKVMHYLTHLKQKTVCIKFGQVTRFDNGKGVLIPATTENKEFQELRQKVLMGVSRQFSYTQSEESSYFYIQLSKMSKDQIKHEINKVLDHFSDKALEELFAFLKQLQSNKPSAFSSSKDLHKILSEDKQLLEKLAK